MGSNAPKSASAHWSSKDLMINLCCFFLCCKFEVQNGGLCCFVKVQYNLRFGSMFGADSALHTMSCHKHAIVGHAPTRWFSRAWSTVQR